MWQRVKIDHVKLSAIWSVSLIVAKSKFEFLRFARRFSLYFQCITHSIRLTRHNSVLKNFNFVKYLHIAVIHRYLRYKSSRSSCSKKSFHYCISNVYLMHNNSTSLFCSINGFSISSDCMQLVEKIRNWFIFCSILKEGRNFATIKAIIST
uniref:Uncharacterized protein n=1 Tax=Parascaris univalens TaxID=6257 RepID=A0A914ZXN6_PARUN